MGPLALSFDQAESGASVAGTESGLGSVGIHAFHPCWAVLHDSDGPLCADGRPMGEDGTALFGQAPTLFI